MFTKWHLSFWWEHGLHMNSLKSTLAWMWIAQSINYLKISSPVATLECKVPVHAARKRAAFEFLSITTAIWDKLPIAKLQCNYKLLNTQEIYYLLLWRIRYYYKDIKGRRFCSTFVLIQTTTMKIKNFKCQ